MKGKCYVVSGYKQRNKVCLEFLKYKLLRRWLLFIDFHVKMTENGTKNMFKEKETTNKVPLMF